ncbi:hypothetical protein GCM10028796_19200 [Ramlibacter monticola]
MTAPALLSHSRLKAGWVWREPILLPELQGGQVTSMRAPGRRSPKPVSKGKKNASLLEFKPARNTGLEKNLPKQVTIQGRKTRHLAGRQRAPERDPLVPRKLPIPDLH